MHLAQRARALATLEVRFIELSNKVAKAQQRVDRLRLDLKIKIALGVLLDVAGFLLLAGRPGAGSEPRPA